MKILLVTAQPFLPQAYGGMQTCADHLCRSLSRRGHKVSVLAGFLGDNTFWTLRLKIQKKLLRRKISRDTGLGYPVWRACSPWDAIDDVVKTERPDLIVVMAVKPVLMALAARKTKTPLLMLLQDVGFDRHGGNFNDLGKVPCIANSRFVADKYKEVFDVAPTVIYPFISPEKYITKTTNENITFINPVIEKGRDLAFEIARLCPDLPFSFVQCWPTSDEQHAELMQKLSQHPNIIYLPSQRDMRRIYSKSRILIVPSQWDEAYGMVVTEAQVSGIPSIASIRGGLPESVGPGGILLNSQSPEDWTKEIRKLWQNGAHYTELSKAAYAYARRPELSELYQTEAYEKAFLAACGN